MNTVFMLPPLLIGKYFLLLRLFMHLLNATAYVFLMASVSAINTFISFWMAY